MSFELTEYNDGQCLLGDGLRSVENRLNRELVENLLILGSVDFLPFQNVVGYANRVKRWFARKRLLVKQEEISSRSGKYTKVDRPETATHEYERGLHCINTVRTLYQPSCLLGKGRGSKAG